MKWNLFRKNYLNISYKELKQSLRYFVAVRKNVSNEVDMPIEGDRRFNIPTDVKMAEELEQFKLMFFEESVPIDNLMHPIAQTKLYVDIWT